MNRACHGTPPRPAGGGARQITPAARGRLNSWAAERAGAPTSRGLVMETNMERLKDTIFTLTALMLGWLVRHTIDHMEDLPE